MRQDRAAPPLWTLDRPSPALTCRLLRSVSKAQPARFRAAEVLPCPPHPTSCKSLSQQAQKIRRAISGCGKEKSQQLPPNWHSKQLQASKSRNELNKPFSPLRVECRLQISTQVTPSLQLFIRSKCQMEPASVKQKTKNWAKGKGPTSSIVLGADTNPEGVPGTVHRGRAQRAGHRGPGTSADPLAQVQLPPPAESFGEQLLDASPTFHSPGHKAGCLGRDSGCTCWIRRRPRVQESSPGLAARRGVGPASSWGGAAGPPGGRNEVESGGSERRSRDVGQILISSFTRGDSLPVISSWGTLLPYL